MNLALGQVLYFSCANFDRASMNLVSAMNESFQTFASCVMSLLIVLEEL